ncbi:hypothetical protein [Streptosporangium sp. 'caverna']|uniref:hypothetical protein n=1 Tax=Streptosporangium sp. 'caverna' TaxID=2202249 RepID=UPI000D7E2FBE|nr:hypothetical protein [Streptosporangium sp. 'caverna']AWS44101.1 hypothetical protein DKM19_24870 [Streptosporangium sp. 'caverna']
MRIRIAAPALVTVGLLTALATAATATTAVAAVPAAPAPCAQQQLALMNAEDAIENVDAAPGVKAAYDALVKAGAAADVDKLSQNMTPSQLGAKMQAMNPAEAKALQAYNAAGDKYLQMRNAALAKAAPQRLSSREALRKCLRAHI